MTHHRMPEIEPRAAWRYRVLRLRAVVAHWLAGLAERIMPDGYSMGRFIAPADPPRDYRGGGRSPAQIDATTPPPSRK